MHAILALFSAAMVLVAPAMPAGQSSAAAPVGQGSASTGLKVRVADYWKFRLARNLDKMYDFYSPAYRAAHPRGEFLSLVRLVRFEIQSFEVKQADIDGSTARVTIRYKARAPQVPEPFESQVVEEWVQQDGQWFKRDEPVDMPFPRGPGRR